MRPNDGQRAPISPTGTKLILRQVTFTVESFDRLKAYQRHLERTEGRMFTNSEALDRLIRDLVTV